MVPLIGTKAELDFLREIIRKTADEIIKAKKSKVKYLVGTMIEIPRAALTADAIAETAEFFSFGTNDLTQMTFGYSRDDIGTFLPDYLDKKILPVDPFQSLDVDRRRPAGGDGASRRAATPVRGSSAASAANTAAIRPASSSAARSA